MNGTQLDSVIRAAISEGILPPGAATRTESERPWPVVLLTALGAWLAAIPLSAIIFLSLDGVLSKGAGPYIVGMIVLGATVAMMRRKKLPLFVEQLTVPGLLVAGCIIGAGLYRDVSDNLAAATLAMITAAVAFLLPRNWLRVLLGAAACALAALALVPRSVHSETFTFWLALHCVLGVWVATQFFGRELRTTALEWFSVGWLVTVLAGLAFWSGMTFLAGASLFGPQGGNTGPLMQQPGNSIAQATSLALAIGAALWIARCWPSMKAPWSAFSALILVALSWLTPSLGAVLLVLSICAGHKRWRLAILAGVAAAWIIGAFYYQVRFPLATKAIIMVVAGALLGAIAWMALRGKLVIASPSLAPTPGVRKTQLSIALSALAVLAVANIGIWQKETLIAEGRPVFIELAPVDPRSLMQGDYMRLGFRLPRTPAGASGRISAVGKIDAKGVVVLDKYDVGAPLAPDEIAIQLTPRAGSWTVVTDAWYFKEGDAKRYERARYGEFRVNAKGRALLVGLRGPALEKL
jgi:uncharacterized membrane-anchored protein